MTIHVTEEHIRKGRRHSCSSCPIALALSEIVDSGVEVHEDHVVLPQTVEYLPFEAKLFIAKFDEAELVEPFSFELDL